MNRLHKSLQSTVNILKSRVTKHSVYGALIAFVTIVFATLLASYFQFDDISLNSIVQTQKTNVVLWFLNFMPFVFAFWGQYTSSIMAYEAGTMIADQTADLRDLTVALEYKATHEATHDSLTYLPNRILLLDRLEQAIQTAARQKSTLAFLVLDVDRFKEINDTFGHFNGDRLLKQMVSRLQGVVRKSDTLARTGSDEFCILMQALPRQGHIKPIVGKIPKIFHKPFAIDNKSLEVQVSIGIALYPDHGKDMDTIMQRANIALAAAKKGTKKTVVYSEELDRHNGSRVTMMGELRHAIENDELVLHYQPKISLKTNRIVGAEALVRWQHPEIGFIFPDEFIPLAERTGLISPLSEWILNKALSQAQKWHEQNLKLGISVNLSPPTLLDTALPDIFIGMLSLYEVPPEYITLEVTEGSMIKNPKLTMEILNMLAEMNIKVSIDDFGTGYSSMAYLKGLPASEVKIDKSFVMDMMNNESDAVIVKSIIDLGHNLSMDVVAEGVEDKQTALRLKQLGCDTLQGYYFSKPMSNTQFLEWIFEKKRKRGNKNKNFTKS